MSKTVERFMMAPYDIVIRRLGKRQRREMGGRCAAFVYKRGELVEVVVTNRCKKVRRLAKALVRSEVTQK